MRDNPWSKIIHLKSDLSDIEYNIQNIEDGYEECERKISNLKEKINELEKSRKLKLPVDAVDILEKNLSDSKSKLALIQNYFFVRKTFILINISITFTITLGLGGVSMSLYQKYEKNQLIEEIHEVLEDGNLSINKKQKEFNNSLIMLNNEIKSIE